MNWRHIQTKISRSESSSDNTTTGKGSTNKQYVLTSSSTNGEGHKTISQCPWGFYHTTIWTWKTHYKMSSPRQYFERKGHKVKSQYPMFSDAPYGYFMLKWHISYCTVAIILHPWYNLDSFTLKLFTCLREDDL